MVQLSHPYMTTEKIIALTRLTFVSKVMSLVFKMLSRLVISFLPRSKCLLTSWLQSQSAVILEPPKTKSLTVSIVSPSICHEVMGSDSTILVFWMLRVFCFCFKFKFIYFNWRLITLHYCIGEWHWMLNFKPTFSFSSFTFIKRLFSSFSLFAIRVVLSAYLRLLIFLPAILIPALRFIQLGISHDVLCI